MGVLMKYSNYLIVYCSIICFFISACDEFSISNKEGRFTNEIAVKALMQEFFVGYQYINSEDIEKTGVSALECAKGGSLSWNEVVDVDDENENSEICYNISSRNCAFEYDNLSLVLEGDYRVCGFPSYIDELGNEFSAIYSAELTLEGRISFILYKNNAASGSSEYEPFDYSYNILFDNISMEKTSNLTQIKTNISGVLQENVDFSISFDETLVQVVNTGD